MDERGFRADAPGAEYVLFANPLQDIKAVRRTPWLGEYSFGPGGAGPRLLSAPLRAPGFELEFEGPWRLGFDSLTAPLLSAAEATYDQDVPTAPGSWIVVSFDRAQPPLVIGFLSGPQQAILQGRPGSWILAGSSPASQRIRIGLPIGSEAFSGRDAAGLGRLVERIKRSEAVWTSPAPKLVGEKWSVEPGGIRLTWTFDRPGSLIPPALILAKAGGYAVEIEGEVLGEELWTPEGPQAFSTKSELSALLPFQGPLPAGRPLVQGFSNSAWLSGGQLRPAEPVFSGIIRARQLGQPSSGAAALKELIGRVIDGPSLLPPSLEAAAQAAAAAACTSRIEDLAAGVLLRAGLAGRLGLNRGRIRRGLPPLSDPGDPGPLSAIFEGGDSARPWLAAFTSPARAFGSGAWRAHNGPGGWDLEFIPPEGVRTPGVLSIPDGIVVRPLMGVERLALTPAGSGRQRLEVSCEGLQPCRALAQGVLELPMSPISEPSAKSTL
jgi:hypothetical protein